MVADLILPDHNQWNVSLLQRLFDVEIKKEILNIPVRPNCTGD